MSARHVALALGAAAVVLGSARPSSAEEDVLRLLRGSHHRQVYDRTIQRMAVGNDEILTVETLTDREILVVADARELGRTSLTVWFADGSVESTTVVVQRDLSVLERALKDVHPGILVEAAPDRDAVVLRGAVPDAARSLAAENVARQYLQARGSKDGEVLVAAGEDTSEPESDPVRVEPSRRAGRGAEVINLLRLDVLPPRVEERVRRALVDLGAPGVVVRRHAMGPVPDDAADVLVLDGSVRSQVMLNRVLQVTARLVLGQELRPEQVRVVADEAGALADASGGGFTGAGGSGFQRRGFGTAGGATFGGGAGTAAANLGNRLLANLGRAEGISIGDGRVLSFVEVEDLPQVRIDVRFFEVNRTDLLRYQPDVSVLASDFDQPSLSPARGAVAAQGEFAARPGAFGGTDVQNVLSFLADGLTEELQVSGSRLAIDAAFNILQSRGLARSLANPSLTVLSGEQALFQVGGEVPIQESFSPAFGGEGADDAGVFNTVTFRAFGVQLGVRPLVGEEGRITLDLVSQVSRPDETLTTALRETTGSNPPTTAFETRSIGTTARLADGDVLLVGGLQDRRTSDSTSFAPWLHDVPLLGRLFERYAMSDDDLELVILVSPVVVREPLPEVSLWAFPEIDPRSMR